MTHATAARRRLIALTVRFQNAVDQIHDDAAWAYSMDSQFDGGEFSGPAIDRMAESDTERAARRFGFATADVAYAAAKLVGALDRDGYRHRLPGEAAPLPQ